MRGSERENGFRYLLLFHSLLFPPTHIRLCCSIHFRYILFLQSFNLFYSSLKSWSWLLHFFCIHTDRVFESEAFTGRALLQAKKGNIFIVMLFSITVGNYELAMKSETMLEEFAYMCFFFFFSESFSNSYTNMPLNSNVKIMYDVWRSTWNQVIS